MDDSPKRCVVSPLARALVRPILGLSQAVPVFALAPILTLWLGFRQWSKIMMALIVFAVLTVLLHAGVNELLRSYAGPPEFMKDAAGARG